MNIFLFTEVVTVVLIEFRSKAGRIKLLALLVLQRCGGIMPRRCRSMLAARANAIGHSHAAAATKTTALLTALYYSYIIIAKAHVQHNTHDQWLLVDAS